MDMVGGWFFGGLEVRRREKNQTLKEKANTGEFLFLSFRVALGFLGNSYSFHKKKVKKVEKILRDGRKEGKFFWSWPKALSFGPAGE